MSLESSSSPSFSPRRRNQLVSSLVDRISPKNSRHQHRQRPSYDRIAHEDVEQGASLPGGERTSPVRATEECDKDWQRFCIDSDDDYDDDEHDDDGDDGKSNRDDCQERRSLPSLPSLLPLESIPANYICPLTLQIMEDPVQDRCGHTFERRAILEWLDRNNHHEAVCPISQKPLIPLGYRNKTGTGSNSLPSTRNDSAKPSCCSYDRVLKRNEGLQKRIQEWKLEHPLYQGVDADYAQKQRRQMLRRDTITTDTIHSTNTSQNYHHSSIDCPYGGETNESGSNNTGNNSNNINSINSSNNNRANRDANHHRLSRFELMLLPQERQVLKTLKERSKEEQERLDRSRKCLVAISIVFAILFLIVMYLVAKGKEETTSLEGEG